MPARVSSAAGERSTDGEEFRAAERAEHGARLTLRLLRALEVDRHRNRAPTVWGRRSELREAERVARVAVDRAPARLVPEDGESRSVPARSRRLRTAGDHLALLRLDVWAEELPPDVAADESV